MPFEFTGLIIGLGLVFIVLLILALNVKIVPQATVFVIEPSLHGKEHICHRFERDKLSRRTAAYQQGTDPEGWQ